MDKHGQRIIEQLWVVARYLSSYFLGLVIAGIVGKIPSGGHFSVVPVNPLVLAVLFITGTMLWKLFPSFRSSKKTLVATIVIGLVYIMIIYLLAVDTPERVIFNTQIMSYLTLPVYTVAVLPFLKKQSIISFQQDKAERDSALFAASIMWLSPFLAEMLIMLKWYTSGNLGDRLSYMVLGGEGTNDVLFFYGFWLLISVELFHLFGRTKLNIKHNSQVNPYLNSMQEDYVWYFAYGSNLYMPQMLSRVGEWRTSRKALLRGWKLIFNVQSPHWGGKTANIIQTKNAADIVYGAIYQITTRKLSVLTEYEHKEPEVIEVESEECKIQAMAYIFQGAESAKPPEPYLRTIISGLRQHGYKEDVIEQIRKNSSKASS